MDRNGAATSMLHIEILICAASDGLFGWTTI